MDTASVDGEQCKRGRRLRRRTTADMVEKVVKDNLKGYSAQDIDWTVVEGATLRQKVTEDKRQNMKHPSSMPIGSHHYRKINDLFPAGDCIAAALQVQDNNAAIHEGLVEASVQLKGVKKNRGPLTDWLSMTTWCNQSALVGVLRIALEEKVHGPMAAVTLVVDIMKMIVRLGLQRVHGQEMALRRSHFDNVLCRIFSYMFRDGVDAAAFWSVCCEVAQLVHAKSDVEMVLAITGEWFPHIEVVDRLLTRSHKPGLTSRKLCRTFFACEVGLRRSTSRLQETLCTAVVGPCHRHRKRLSSRHSS